MAANGACVYERAQGAAVVVLTPPEVVLDVEGTVFFFIGWIKFSLVPTYLLFCKPYHTNYAILCHTM